MTQQRARSFGTVSEDYDRFRPGPAPAVAVWLVGPDAHAVIDLGAGTGALTGVLAGRVEQVTAVEPDERMRAVPEAARVLRPGGTLGVVWTGMDREIGWIDDLQRTIRAQLAPPVAGRERGPRHLRIPDACATAFAPVQGPHLVRHARRFTREALVGLAGTYSAMIIHPDRAALLDGVRRALADDPRFADPAGTEIPMVSRCFRARRLATG
jgi:SAM-dependent methyltransferase